MVNVDVLNTILLSFHPASKIKELDLSDYTREGLAELQELHGPLGAWYAASGLAHGEYPATPEGLADWPAFGEMTERFLAAAAL